jgi:hypothetical protein
VSSSSLNEIVAAAPDAYSTTAAELFGSGFHQTLFVGTRE